MINTSQVDVMLHVILVEGGGGGGEGCVDVVV